MYVPFWIFDCGVEAGAGARATRVSHWADSQYSHTRTDHFLLQRGGGLQCRGVPVDGSQKMDNTWMEAIQPYDYTQAVPFDMAYLSGYLADQYDVSSEACQPIANAPGPGHGGGHARQYHPWLCHGGTGKQVCASPWRAGAVYAAAGLGAPRHL